MEWEAIPLEGLERHLASKPTGFHCGKAGLVSLVLVPGSQILFPFSALQGIFFLTVRILQKHYSYVLIAPGLRGLNPYGKKFLKNRIEP